MPSITALSEIAFTAVTIGGNPITATD